MLPTSDPAVDARTRGAPNPGTPVSSPRVEPLPRAESSPLSESSDRPGANGTAQPIPGDGPGPVAEPPTPASGSRALLFLTVLATLYTLYYTRAILLPVALGVVLSLLLRPAVRWLGRHRVPETVAAAACLATLVSLFSFGVFSLAGPAREWLEQLPGKFRQAESKLQGMKKQFGEFRKAKASLEEFAAGSSAEQPVEVQVQPPTLTSNAVLLSTTGTMLASAGLVIVLAYFLLTSGDLLINNILSTMPTFREKRQIVELIQNVQKGVSSYLLAVTMINAGLGLAVGLAMWMVGLPNAALVGVMIAFLNFVPYLGDLVCGTTIAVVSFLTFDSLAHASVAPLVFIAITTFEGQVVTPALLGRQMSLNPIMVFLFLTFWGWMWGVGGAVLAIPILSITRISCNQFERTRSLGTMLGG